MKLLSLAKFGALHGVTKQAAARWKARGLLVIVNGKVDADASNEKLKKLRVGGAPGAVAVDANVKQLTVDSELTIRKNESASTAAERILVASGAQMTIDEAKCMKENYLALLNQLEYDKESGLVVMAADVAKVVGDEYAKVRTRLLSIPSELAPRLLRIRTAPEMQSALGDAITEALEELTSDDIA